MSKAFVRQVGKLLSGEEIDAEEFWRELEEIELQQSLNNSKASPSIDQIKEIVGKSKVNSYYYTLKLFETMAKPATREKQLLNSNRILNTIMGLQYFRNTKKKTQAIIDECTKALSHPGNKLNSHTQWILRMSISSCDEASLIKGFVRAIAMVPLQYDDNKQPGKILQQQLLNHEQTEVPQQSFSTLNNWVDPCLHLELCYSYICFLDLLIIKDLVIEEKIYMEVTSCIKFLLNAAHTQTVALELLLTLLAFLEKLIKFYLIPFTNLIKELLILMEACRSFPHPVGTIAHDLLSMLYKELRSRGTNYRQHLRSMIPSLDSLQEQDLKLSAYLVRKDDQLYGQEQFCSLDAARKAIISNILTIHGTQKDELYNRIQLLPQKTAFNYYGRLLKMLEITEQLENFQEVRAAQKKCIGRLIQEIEIQPLEHDSHSRIEIESMYQDKVRKVFEFPGFEIIPVDEKTFCEEKTKGRNFFNLLRLKKSQMPYHKQKFRILVQLPDRQFRKVVQTICQGYLKSKVPQEELYGLQVFVLPSRREMCHLAHFLATKDRWYSMFVYNMFRHSCSFPDLESENDRTKDLLPNKIKQQTLQMYLRQADRVYNVKVFKCRLKRKGFPDETYFFCQYLFIGLSAAVEFYKRTKNKYAEHDPMDIYLNKMKDVERSQVDFAANLELTMCDSFGKPYIRSVLPETRFHNFQLCHLPVSYFNGKYAEPHSNKLQLSILPAQNTKAFQKQLTNKGTSIFGKVDKEQAKANFSSLFMNYSVSGLKIQPLASTSDSTMKSKLQTNGQTAYTKGTMNVVLDGELIENVEILEVVPAFGEGEFSIPLHVFTPFFT